MKAKLTPKQRLFVANLIRLNYNATAAVKATYGENPHAKNTPKWQLFEASARARGSENLTKPNVSEAVRLAQRRVIEKAEVDEDMIVSALAAMVFTNLDDVAPWDEKGLMLTPSDELPWRFKAAVRGIEITRKVYTEKGEDGQEGESYTVENVKFRMAEKAPFLKLLMQHMGLLQRGVRDINVGKGGVANVDQRSQSLLISEKLAGMSPEEILAAAMALPAEPDEEDE